MGARTSECSDGDLLGRVREGDTEAYGELWRRHQDAGVEAARRITQSFEPDDLVQESFARILQALRSGNGPSGAFRPYLYTTIRNTAASWASRGRPAVPLEHLTDEHVPTTQDDHHRLTQSGLLGAAYAALPHDWAEVLWYTEVENLNPTETGRLLGIAPAAASSLAYRAREGLRREWLQAHVSRLPEVPACRWVAERVGDYHRDALSNRAKTRFEAHVDECPDCPVLVAEVGDEAATLVGARLRGLLLLAVFGIPAGPGLAPVTPPRRRIRRPGRTAVAATVSVLAAGAVALAVIGPRQPVDDTPPSAAQGPQSAAVPPTDDAQDDVLETEDDDSGDEFPQTPPTPAPDDTERVDVIEVFPVAVAESQPPVPAIGTGPVTSGPMSPTTPVDPTEPTEPTEPVELTPEVPVFGDIINERHYTPWLSGTGTPGAVVRVRTTDGLPAGETTVTQDGSWEFYTRMDTLTAGTSYFLVANQTVGALTSPDTDPVGPFVGIAPELLTPTEGAQVMLTDQDGDQERDDILVDFTGTNGARVEVAVDGVSTGNLHALDGGTLTRMVRNLAPGEHTIALRYVDPDLGWAGGWSRTTFTTYLPVQDPDILPDPAIPDA